MRTFFTSDEFALISQGLFPLQVGRYSTQDEHSEYEPRDGRENGDQLKRRYRESRSESRQHRVGVEGHARRHQVAEQDVRQPRLENGEQKTTNKFFSHKNKFFISSYGRRESTLK